MGAVAQMRISSDGKVGIGCDDSPFNKLHVKGNVYIQSANAHASMQIQTGATDPRLATTSSDIVMYRIGALSGFANIQCKKLYEKSDRDAKTNIQPLEKNSLEKICRLNGYTFNWKDDESGAKDVGLIAQEVEKIIPEIVKTADSTSGKLVSYTSIIPYLIEAIKEQQEKITELEKTIAKLETFESAELKSTPLFTEEKTSETPASLSQNKPNPFSSETRIEMFVPQSVANATLYVYDLQGKQVKSITVTDRGATFETIHGSELQAGLYIYSLITDGKLVGSKQMVLTE
jgi:hypothetical protein